MALQLNTPEQLRELPLPFIAHLRKNNGWYVLVTALQGDTITYTDNGDQRTNEPLADFEKKWSGVVLLAEVNPTEANQPAGEDDYYLQQKQEILDDLRGPFVWASAALILLIALLMVAVAFTATGWLLLLTKATGLALSGLLVAKSLGSQNALTDRLCQINSKTNCDSVLNAPAAKLWGWLPWADVGLLYFAGGFLAIWLSPSSPSGLQLLHWGALLALPYTVFSVYYQGVVLRQWCPLCLGVQVVLILEGVLALTQLPDYRFCGSPMGSCW